MRFWWLEQRNRIGDRDMKAGELTKKDVNEMSDAEVVFWFKEFAETEQVLKMRQHMLNEIEIHEAQTTPRILPLHVDNEVVN